MAHYELNLLDYWMIIRKRKLLIGLTSLLVVLFTFALTQLTKSTPVYQATARVKFDKTSNMASLFLDAFSYSYANAQETQSEVIRSVAVIEQAAARLGLIPASAPEETRRSREYRQIVESLRDRIDAAPENQTSIIGITGRSENPVDAENIANAVAEAYRSENIRSRNRMVTDALDFVGAQLAEREQKLGEAEEALRQFKEREGQVFLTEEAKAALSIFTELEQEHNRVLRLKEQTARQIEILKRTRSLNGLPSQRIFTDDTSTLLASLNTRLVDLVQERTTLLIDYKTQHPAVRLVDQKIANVKLEMTRELVSKLQSLADREATLRGQIDRYRERYLGFPQAAIELSRLEREVQVNAELYATLKTKQQELLIKSAERIEEVSIISPAVSSGVPINRPKNELNMVVGAAMGLFLGVVLAFGRESFDTSIGTIEGIEEFLKVPVLGIIPQFDERELRENAAKALPPNTSKSVLEMFSKLPCLVDPASVLSENLRSLRTNLQFANMDRTTKSLVFTSVGTGEGKSTTIVNLAITLAQEGKRVLLVDGDMHKPNVHKRLGMKRDPGLAEALSGTTPWNDSVRTVTDLMMGALGVDLVMNTPGLDNLHVLTSGMVSRNPAEFLSLDRINRLISEMREEYEMVLFDTPPILPVTDAVTISSCVDGTVLVYQVGRIGRSALRRAKFLIDHAQAHVVGVVLTNVKAEIAPEYGYMEYSYR